MTFADLPVSPPAGTGFTLRVAVVGNRCADVAIQLWVTRPKEAR
jgi:hypothetical protein